MMSAATLGILLHWSLEVTASDGAGISRAAGAVTIVATDEGYEYPASIPGGLSHVLFENRGSRIHEVMFVKLPDDMSGEDYLQAVRDGMAFPQGALDYSGPGLTAPGRRVEMWLELDPGTYLLACWFRGHLKDVPVHTMAVTEPLAEPAVPPAHDATLRMIDFRFELEGSLEPGPQVLRIETPGPSMHEVDIYHLHQGKTLADLQAWYGNDKRGAPPATPVGGVLDSHDISRTVWLKAEFEPGRHVLWCGMPMVQNASGPAADVSHADAGMYRELVIEEKDDDASFAPDGGPQRGVDHGLDETANGARHDGTSR